MANPANTPAHVRADSAVSLRLYDRTVIRECPQEVLVPEIHRTLGPITWVSNIAVGLPGGWLLTHVEDINEILRDAERYTKKGMAAFAQSIGEDWLTIPTEPDPPLHAEYRRPLNPYFAPQRMAAMRDQLRDRADRLICSFKDRGECDFVKEFSQKYPIYIVLDLLGLRLRARRVRQPGHRAERGMTNRLRALRAERGWSQGDLAERLDVLAMHEIGLEFSGG